VVSAESFGKVSRFRIFGLNVQADFALPVPWPMVGPVDVHIAQDDALPLPTGVPVISLPFANPDGGKGLEVFGERASAVVVVDAVAIFSCRPGRITYRLLRRLPMESMLWQLLGFVFSLWLELGGHRVFHAAAISLKDSAIGLLGHSGAGKSSMAAALAMAGGQILGDDHLVLRRVGSDWRAIRALPWLKLAPDAASALGYEAGQLPLLHPGVRKRRFDLPVAWRATEAVPFAQFFILRRDANGPVQIGPRLTPAGAISQLMLHSSVPKTAQALGLGAERLAELAHLATRFPMRVLSYPDDLGRLADVVDVL
jgi:hypothetical protein